MSHHLLATACKLAEDKALALIHLRETTRMLEAVRLTAGLGSSQIERLNKAKRFIAAIEAQEQEA